jgi:hypothetical protein
LEILSAQTVVDDRMLMREWEKDYLDKEIKNRLARELAFAIMKDDRFNKIVLKREDHPFTQMYGETVYTVEAVMLTREEAKEYRELLKLKEMLKYTVR